MEEPLWVRTDVVLAIHQRQLAEHGGTEGVRDQSLLDSALARPKNLLAYSEQQVDMAALAAAYAFGITRNHPFVDGNKRTAFVVCRTFLILNRYDLDASPDDEYVTFFELSRGNIAEGELTKWIRTRLKSTVQ